MNGWRRIIERMPNITRRCLTYAAGVGLLTVLAGADWPQFLGPQRNGVSSETSLIDQWPADGLKVVWRKAGGVGMSGLAVSQNRLATLVQRDGNQWVVALDAATGEEKWRTPLAPAYKNSMGDGPRATPTIDGDVVYAFTGEGILAALSLSDGDVRWSSDVVEKCNGKVADYGMASSPLVVDGKVIVTAGAPNAAVVACDAKTGEIVYKCGDGPAGYSSPALLNAGDREQVVAFIGDAAIGFAPADGKQLWRYSYVTDYDCNIATPIAYDGSIFISSGENHGCAMLSLKPAAAGFNVEESWTSQGPRSVMRNEWQTSVLVDGHLYGFDNVGSAGAISHFNCVNVATGERAWQELRYGKGNLIAADGKLWISTMQGELVAARATPKGYEEIGRMQVCGPTRQAPALANGLLYLRDDAEIVCVSVRRE